MRAIQMLAGTLCCFLGVACSTKKQEATDMADDRKPLEFNLPEVPVVLQSVEDRLDFVVRHYWDCFDFKDTTYIHAPDVTEQALVNYMDLLFRVPSPLSDSCLVHTLQQASQENKMLAYFAKTFRHYLFNPNSPLHQERLYEPVGRFLSACPLVDEAVRSRALHDLKLINMNREGSVASDFVYTLSSGEQQRMHAIRSPYTLLLFYNPDCQECAETLTAMKTSSVLNSPSVMEQVKILAFYPDEDHDIWMKHRNEIPGNWINSYDKKQVVLAKELYDLKAMPTLYLLDKDKKVLLKDARMEEIENYFKNK